MGRTFDVGRVLGFLWNDCTVPEKHEYVRALTTPAPVHSEWSPSTRRVPHAAHRGTGTITTAGLSYGDDSLAGCRQGVNAGEPWLRSRPHASRRSSRKVLVSCTLVLFRLFSSHWLVATTQCGPARQKHTRRSDPQTTPIARHDRDTYRAPWSTLSCPACCTDAVPITEARVASRAAPPVLVV